MVTCASCSVNTIDRHCTNTPRTCYECCTTSSIIHTCPPHFHQMGLPAQRARLDTRLVHPHILADAADEASPSFVPPHPAPQEDPPPLVDPPLPPPVLSLATVAGDVAGMRAQFAAMQLLIEQVARSLPAAPATSVVPAIPPALVGAPPPLPFVPVPPPRAIPAQVALDLAPAPPAPHRAAVLHQQPAASQHAALSNLIERAARGSLPAEADFDEDDSEVIPQPHTHSQQLPSAPLPEAFVPTVAGSAQSAQQQLTAIINGLNKQNTKVKYSTIEELNEALDDWAIDSVNAGWASRQVESIRAYQRLLIFRFSFTEKLSLKVITEYHRKWCKAVHAGTIDMFALGAELNLVILHEVKNPLQLSPSAGSSPSNSQLQGARRGKAPGPSPKVWVRCYPQAPSFLLFLLLLFGRSTPCSLVWWLLCLQWSGLPTIRRQSGCQS
jgi:hypothetical protein